MEEAKTFKALGVENFKERSASGFDFNIFQHLLAYFGIFQYFLIFLTQLECLYSSFDATLTYIRHDFDIGFEKPRTSEGRVKLNSNDLPMWWGEKAYVLIEVNQE